MLTGITGAKAILFYVEIISALQFNTGLKKE